jgi:hypothetical protein
MKKKSRGISVVGISLIVHVAVLFIMWAIPYNLLNEQAQIVIETFFSEERDQQEFSKEIELSTEVSETTNTMAASTNVATSAAGASGSAVAQQNIETSESLKEPELFVSNAGDITLPGDGEIEQDLGEGLVDGGMDVVSGYGPALGRISQELLRMMRESRVHVVWLFDESDSMKDDQEMIRQKFDKVYTELGIQIKTDDKLKRDADVLWTTIWSYGEKVDPITPKPTSNINEIRAAINKISIDESGKEHMCRALIQAFDTFGAKAARAKRKLVVILVTDESGDDGQFVEDVIERAKRFKSPVFVLGRESVFGYPYARIRWKDPKYGLNHWLRINRGPETAWPECLQWDGFHARWDADRSNFGPFEQVRIAKESGGVYFMLPGEEENLVGRAAQDKRKFDFLDMKEYQPDLDSRRNYEDARKKSKFRTQIWNVIKVLNPHLDSKLNINHHHYAMDPAEFQKQGAEQFQRAWRAMNLSSQGLAMLEEIKPLRAEESSQRWRANYDLATAQLLSYRVRLFQFLLALDKHVANPPKPRDPKNNEWHIVRRQEMVEPDSAQFTRLKQVYKLKIEREELLQDLKEQQARSRKMYQFVIAEHPGTPWQRRATRELSMGYGITFIDYFWDPRYRNIGKEIKFPKP